MTIVAAYSDGSTICLGSDSCGISSGTKTEFGAKIIKKGNYYIGFADSYRVADILSESKTLPKTINKLQDIKDLRDKIRAELICKMGASPADSEAESISHPLSIIVISILGIHEIQSDYAILKAKDNFTSIGAGRDIALGALATHNLYISLAKDAVRESIKTTIKYSTDCGGRIHLVTINLEGK